MKIKLDDGAFMPRRMHATDAGLDLRATYSRTIFPRDSAVFDTGVHIELPHNTFGLLMSKSGLNVKRGLISEGVIDEGYIGSITVKLYNLSDTIQRIEKGDKISQLIVVPCRYEELEVVDELSQTDRGNNGFGSTGR